jgi:hypothetical protein
MINTVMNIVESQNLQVPFPTSLIESIEIGLIEIEDSGKIVGDKKLPSLVDYKFNFEIESDEKVFDKILKSIRLFF